MVTNTLKNGNGSPISQHSQGINHIPGQSDVFLQRILECLNQRFNRSRIGNATQSSGGFHARLAILIIFINPIISILHRLDQWPNRPSITNFTQRVSRNLAHITIFIPERFNQPWNGSGPDGR